VTTDWRRVFEELVRAETEAEVTAVLTRHRLLDERFWLPLGGEENNYAIVGNQAH
jgi:hypothetical protein